jgi:hypothetical protein
MAKPDAEVKSADTQFKAKVEQLSQFKSGVVDLHATCAHLLRTMRDWTKHNKDGVTRWDAFLQSDLPLGAPPPLATASSPAVKFPPESVISPMRELNAEMLTVSNKWMMQDGAYSACVNITCVPRSSYNDTSSVLLLFLSSLMSSRVSLFLLFSSFLLFACFFLFSSFFSSSSLSSSSSSSRCVSPSQLLVWRVTSSLMSWVPWPP